MLFSFFGSSIQFFATICSFEPAILPIKSLAFVSSARLAVRIYPTKACFVYYGERPNTTHRIEVVIDNCSSHYKGLLRDYFIRCERLSYRKQAPPQPEN